jgi:hypothetical protein
MKKLSSITLAAGLVVAGTVSTVGMATAANASTADAAASAPYRVTLKVSESKAIAEETTLSLKGKVSPKPKKGSPVLLQIQYEGQDNWKTIRKVGVKKDGTYAFTDKPSSSLEREYRVVKGKDAGGAKGTSRERAVDVQVWEWLDSFTSSAGADVLDIYEIPVNGETYRRNLVLDRTKDKGFEEWTLGRKCTAFESTLGLSDRTETGGQGGIVVTSDGVAKYARTFNLGESELKTIDVTGVYRMRIDFSQVTTTPDTEPTAAAARVLCD